MKKKKTSKAQDIGWKLTTLFVITSIITFVALFASLPSSSVIGFICLGVNSVFGFLIFVGVFDKKKDKDESSDSENQPPT
jgi:hypothetical protein